jgi:integrase
LTDEKGLPIKTVDEAKAAKTKFMAPFMVSDKVAALESIAAKLGGTSAAVVAADDQTNPPLKAADAWAAFEKSPRRPDCGPVTLGGYEGQWKRFAKWMEARVKGAALRDVDAATAEAYAANLTAGKVSPNTYNKHLTLLKLVWRILGRTPGNKIVGNPWVDIQRRRLSTQSHRELTIEELKRVCGAATGELRILFGIGLYTGLRLADVVTLQWGEVDLVRGIIQRVPRKTARHTGKAVMIPLHSTLAAMLAETPEADRRGPVLPDLCAKYEKGRYLATRVIQDHFHTCGIETAGVGHGCRAPVTVGFHSLRHTFVSLCRAAGTPLSVVEAIVGHSSPAMTQHYTHTGEVAARAAIALLPGLGEPEVSGQKSEVSGGKAEASGQKALVYVESATPAAMARAALTCLEAMTVKNWEAKRDEALKALRGATEWLEGRMVVQEK